MSKQDDNLIFEAFKMVQEAVPQGGGKVAGQVSQTPGAIKKREQRAAAKTAPAATPGAPVDPAHNPAQAQAETNTRANAANAGANSAAGVQAAAAPAPSAQPQPNQGEVAQGQTAETQDTTNQNAAQTAQANPNAAAGAPQQQDAGQGQMNQMVDFVMKSATSTPQTAQALVKLLQTDTDLWPIVQKAMMADADFSQKLFQQFGQAMQAGAAPDPAAAANAQAADVGAAYGV